MFRLLVIALLSALALRCDAFVAPQQRTFVSALQMSDGESGAAIAKPQIKQATTVVIKEKQKSRAKQRKETGDPISKRKEEFEEAPLFKVMLIGDDAYDIGHVIERICGVMEDLDEDAAATIFKAAQASGKAMCGKYPMEYAETYKEQLLRSEPMIFADIEDENE